MPLRAVIAGATGLIGSNLAEHLGSRGWEVYGVARKPETGIRGVRPVAADCLEPASLRTALAGIDPTHVFFTTWVRKVSEEEREHRRKRRPGAKPNALPDPGTEFSKAEVTVGNALRGVPLSTERDGGRSLHMHSPSCTK